jgi:hypothetical protein
MSSSPGRVILSVSIATLLTIGKMEGQVIVRGTNLVELRAADASAGTPNWINSGSLGGSFTEVGDASVSTINAGAFGIVPVVNFDPNEAYRGPTAPAAITGSGTRSIEVWIQNPTLATEDTMVAWGHRGGPDGTNLAFNNGSNATFGAVGHWASADMGWNGTPVAGELHHLVYTYDGTTARVYADGVEKNSKAVALNTHALATDTINLIAQNNASGALEFISSDGMNVSVLRVDTGVLSAADVMNNFNAGPLVAIPEPGSAALLGLAATGLVARRRRTG